MLKQIICRFDDVKMKISAKYDEIEMTLIQDFCAAQRKPDHTRMKEIAQVLSQFKSYPRCIDAFIELSQAVRVSIYTFSQFCDHLFLQGCLSSKDVFGNILMLCKYNYDVIKKVFNNPEQVMLKFVLNIYQLKLHEYVQSRLNSKLDNFSYLKVLYELYSK